MNRRPIFAVIAALALLSSAYPAQAQDRLSFDLSLGTGSGSGHVLQSGRGFLTLGAALATQATRLGPARVMAGLALTRQAQGPHGDVGYFQPDGTMIGGAWPFFRALSAIGALDFPGPIAARVTAGVGAYKDNLSYTTGGLSGTADVTIPGRARAGLLLSGTGTLLPSYRGGSYHTGSFGIGVRFTSR